MRKKILFLFAFMSVFLIGASGVSAKTLNLHRPYGQVESVTIPDNWNEEYTYVFTDSDAPNKLSVFYVDNGSMYVDSTNYGTSKGFSFFYTSDGSLSNVDYYGGAWAKSKTKISFYYASNWDITFQYDGLMNVFDQQPDTKVKMQNIISTFYNTMNMPFMVFYKGGQGIKILYTPDGTGFQANATALNSKNFNYISSDGVVYCFDSLSNVTLTNLSNEQISESISDYKSSYDDDLIDKNTNHSDILLEDQWVLVWYGGFDYLATFNAPYSELTWNQENFTSMIPTLDYQEDFIIDVNPSPTPTPDINYGDIITDDDVTGSTNNFSNFFNGFSTDTFGLTSIITAPLNLIKSITSKTCTPLVLQVPFLNNQTINLPCLTPIYQEFFGSFLTVYQTITFGIIAYWVCVRIFALVKDFKNPDSDRIEVLDL